MKFIREIMRSTKEFLPQDGSITASLEHGARHPRLVLRNGERKRTVILATSPSDKRFMANAMAQIKQAVAYLQEKQS